jgi:hypothetical protein
LHYSFVLDKTIGTDPPRLARLARLPAKSPAVSCVVLEHADISYTSLWQHGRHTWEVRHQRSREQPEPLEFWGDLPRTFISIWEAALVKQRQSERVANPANGLWTTFATCRSMWLLE